MTELLAYTGPVLVTPKRHRLILLDAPHKPTVYQAIGEPYGLLAEDLLRLMLYGPKEEPRE